MLTLSSEDESHSVQQPKNQGNVTPSWDILKLLGGENVQLALSYVHAFRTSSSSMLPQKAKAWTSCILALNNLMTSLEGAEE